MKVVAVLAAVCAVLQVSTVAAATQYLAYSSHTDSACSSTPKQVAFVPSAKCSSTTASTCKKDSTTGLYLSTSCITSPSTHTTTVFIGKPWILFDIHEPNGACSTVVSSIGYLADGSCLVVDDQSSSVIASVNANKSASVAVYDGAKCGGTPTKSHVIDSSDLGGTSCIEGLFLVSTSKETTTTVVQPKSNDAVRLASMMAATLLAVAASLA